MAQSMVYTVELPWLPHPLCPPDIAPILERAIQAFPPHFLLEPIKGEVFDDAQDCLKRLQGFALHRLRYSCSECLFKRYCCQCAALSI